MRATQLYLRQRAVDGWTDIDGTVRMRTEQILRPAGFGAKLRADVTRAQRDAYVAAFTDRVNQILARLNIAPGGTR